MRRYVKLFEQFILESGNAIGESVPFTQDQIQPTIDWMQKNIFPEIGLVGIGDDAAIIGSAGKKLLGATSGDIDIAVSADKIASALGTSLELAYLALDEKLKSLGYPTLAKKGFNQVSVGVPIAGDQKNGIGQVDLMITTDLEWSKFMYHSPDFRTAESLYKGAYRNLLLMSAMGQCFFAVKKTTDKGETEEYEAYVIRLNQGVVQVRKTFMGKRGLRKTTDRLREYDKEITRVPQEIVDLLFNGGHSVAEIMTYEGLKSLLDSGDFKYPEKLQGIMDKYKNELDRAGLPLPSELA